MKLAWKIGLGALVTLRIGEAVSGFDAADTTSFRYAVLGVSVLLAFLLFRNAAPVDTGRLTRFMLMAHGVLLTGFRLPFSRLSGRPVWPDVFFVAAGMILFHLARTRLRGGQIPRGAELEFGRLR